MRLFIAVSLSPPVREALLAAQRELRRQGRGAFPPPENLHLTLAFLGETDRPAQAEAALNAVSGRPFLWRWAAPRAISATCGGPASGRTRRWRTWPCLSRRISGPGALPSRTAPSGPTSPWSAAGGAALRR